MGLIVGSKDTKEQSHDPGDEENPELQAAQAVAETAPVPGLYVPAEQGAQELDFESK